jgi:DNA-binding PucR family transcriptional regulator
VRADECWAEVTAARLKESLARCLTLENPLRRLQEHDRASGSRLGETLKTWLDHNCESASAAAALHLHPNSLRYRLKRVQEVSGLELDDARVRALAHLLLVG